MIKTFTAFLLGLYFGTISKIRYGNTNEPPPSAPEYPSYIRKESK